MKAIAYNVQPTPGRVAIRRAETAELTEGGLHIPESHRALSTVGEVVATCDSYTQAGEDYDAIFEVGDVVIFGQFTGTEIQVGREKVVILRENDILARLIPADKAGNALVQDTRRVTVNPRA